MILPKQDCSSRYEESAQVEHSRNFAKTSGPPESQHLGLRGGGSHRQTCRMAPSLVAWRDVEELPDFSSLDLAMGKETS